MGFPGGWDSKESAHSAGDLGWIPGLRRSPGEGNWPTAVFLPKEVHGQRSLAGYSPWGHIDVDMTEWLSLSLSLWLMVMMLFIEYLDFPGGSLGEASAYNAGDLGSIPGSGRSSGEGNGNPLQYSCLENPMDGGAW